MVYGKILFNNIKEYTPKWYPTIPYSQTVKPVFGIIIYDSTQVENHNLHGHLMQAQQVNHFGEILHLYSKDNHGCGKY